MLLQPTPGLASQRLKPSGLNVIYEVNLGKIKPKWMKNVVSRQNVTLRFLLHFIKFE